MVAVVVSREDGGDFVAAVALLSRIGGRAGRIDETCWDGIVEREARGRDTAEAEESISEGGRAASGWCRNCHP
ncbi:unnamed protein product [Chondrus crispus]|uniref:Uncharacterized protein n=1 Tax=Chondrus crispus TaxID=2769 RepID=R7QP78_CHOCR|nr:unnamed protein product [Chondrus crispus]CDF39568.1 unnamed protein product [Chondrus crispus]|eukprot:XP_005709862.1 unnamed protein product [Chondrus crispus]